MDLKPFITGNILLLVCCAFYLVWWLIAFHPEHGIRGMKTGWLLIPAAVTGILAVVTIVRGIAGSEIEQTPVSAAAICAAGVIVYFVLLAGTWFLMKRPVTTELVLIIGWTVLVASEINALYGGNCLGRCTALELLISTIIMAIISLICYLAYYNLDPVKGYYDGAVPLALVAVMTIVMLIKLI